MKYHSLMTFATPVSRSNNFDLIRLFAALTVALSHLAQHGIITNPAGVRVAEAIWELVPGVPIFFIVSGFLITNSWLNQPSWRPYLTARALRIFPALFVSTCVRLHGWRSIPR